MADGRGQAARGGEPVPEVPGYRIERRLGHGSMGVVYLAEDLQLHRKVALKVLTPALAEDELFRKRFDRESQNAATLDHPNIVPVYAAGQANGLLYIAMRYVRGGDLRSLLDTNGPLSLDQASSVIAAVADALDAAHAHGMIHRDVKPANILIDDHAGQKHYYLSDFGITKNVSADRSLTSVGQVIGTIDYIAPEHIQGKTVDARSDLYALGCVLYQCLTGVVPFERADTAALMWAHVQDEPPLVSTRCPDLPPQVDHIVATAMAKQPEDRYPTCRDFALALRTIATPDPAAGHGRGTAVLTTPSLPPLAAEGMTSTATVIGAAAQAPVRAPSTGRRKWWWAAGGVLALVLAAGATVGVMTYLRSQFPNAAERTLLNHVPLALKKGCDRNPEADPAQVQASVICTSSGDGPSTVTYTTFKSPQALDSHYQEAVANGGTGLLDVGDCTNTDRAERTYTDSTGRTSGRIVCYQNLGSSIVSWSDGQTQTLATAIRLDSDYPKLRNWWLSVMGLPAKAQLEADAKAEAAAKRAAEAETRATDTANENEKLKKQHTDDEKKIADKAKANANPNQPNQNQPQPQGGGQQAQPPQNQPQPQGGGQQAQPPQNPPAVGGQQSQGPVPDKASRPSLTGQAPSAPGSRQAGSPVAGSGGCIPVGGTAYSCTLSRPAFAYTPGSTDAVGPLGTANKQAGFLCQTDGPKYSIGTQTGHWWAWGSMNNDGVWVPTVFLSGGIDNEPIPGLPICGKSGK